MTETNGAARFDLLLVRDFLGARECEEIAAEMRAGGGGPAAVYGQGGGGASGAVDERIRKGVRAAPSPETVGLVSRRLSGSVARVEEHFGVRLGGCEEPQFLRYRAGDFFVAHQDGNTGLLRSDREARLVSTVIFLSRQTDEKCQGDYRGGSLVFSDWRPNSNRGEFSLSGEPGTLVAFRSETTHEVTPVTSGERLSIACWYR